MIIWPLAGPVRFPDAGAGDLGWGLPQEQDSPLAGMAFPRRRPPPCSTSPMEQRPRRGEWLAAAGFGQEKGDTGAKVSYLSRSNLSPHPGRGPLQPREPSVWAGEGPVLSAGQGSSAKEA